eukprot:6658781-Alexandrium_andersonii.AAC.1
MAPARRAPGRSDHCLHLLPAELERNPTWVPAELQDLIQFPGNTVSFLPAVRPSPVRVPVGKLLGSECDPG